MNDDVLRESLAGLFLASHAHVDPKKALAGVKPKLRGVRPGPKVPSVWEELEHLRIAQEDLLRYTLDPAWKSPEWPDGYWPRTGEVPTERQWRASVAAFLRDTRSLAELARDRGCDLTAPIPHGGAHTPLREILLAAVHNAYHLGQIVQTRRLLKNWPG